MDPSVQDRRETVSSYDLTSVGVVPDQPRVPQDLHECSVPPLNRPSSGRNTTPIPVDDDRRHLLAGEDSLRGFSYQGGLFFDDFGSPSCVSKGTSSE